MKQRNADGVRHTEMVLAVALLLVFRTYIRLINRRKELHKNKELSQLTITGTMSCLSEKLLQYYCRTIQILFYKSYEKKILNYKNNRENF